MTNSHTIDISGIGPVLFEKSRRARRVIITVRNSKSVRVAVPMRTSFGKALEFVGIKTEWIRRNQAKFRQIEQRRNNLQASAGTIDRAEAGQKLVARLRHLADKHGFRFNRVFIRNQKTRWGSCSARHNISLNIKLALLPGELIDYVILHELVHTRFLDHSKDFWSELDKYVGNARAMSKSLRKNGLALL